MGSIGQMILVLTAGLNYQLLVLIVDKIKKEGKARWILVKV